MAEVKQLKSVLGNHLAWQGARLTFLAMFLIALLKVKTVNLAEIATALNPRAQVASNYRRLQRFFAEFELDYGLIAKLVVALLPCPAGGYILSLDRTEWQFGHMWINLLTLGIVYKGVAFPVFWTFLGKRGNSNTAERMELVDRCITTLGVACMAYLTADREFVGKKWFTYLKQHGLLFRIRIKQNFKIESKGKLVPVGALFQHLTLGETYRLARRRSILGMSLYLVGMRLEDGDYLLIVTAEKPCSALADYAQRWGIETLFGILKSRGFRFEETHLTEGDRICKMVALLTLATLWAFRVGEWLHEQIPLKIKTHGRLAQSIFRYGLDFLRSIVFHIQLRFDDFQLTLEFLSCT